MAVLAKSTMKTISERVRENLAASPEGAFLRLLTAQGNVLCDWTYEALVSRALCWTSFYQSRGLVIGDRVVIILKHSGDLYASYLGAILGGFIPAMFSYPSVKHSEEEYCKSIGQLLENAAPRIGVVYPELHQMLTGHLQSKEKTLLADAESVVHPPARWEDLPSVDPSESAFLQYSSGTTGLKKGVAVSHTALLWQVDRYSEMIGLAKTDCIASWLPLYHDMGLITCYFLPILKRIPLTALCPFEWVARPQSLLRIITDYRATLCWLPNFAYTFLAKNVRNSAKENFDLSSLRGLINCSEPVMSQSHEAFFQRFKEYGIRADVFCASYAMAENTFAVTSGGFDEPLQIDRIDGAQLSSKGVAVKSSADSGVRILVSSGKALPDTEIRICAENGKDLDDRQVGEIVIRTPSLMRGYYRNEAATALAVKDGWYWTGDMGYKAGGQLFVTGRKKEMLIIAGQNVYPQDVEACIQDVSGVIPGRVVALGVTDERKGTEELVILAEINSEFVDEKKLRQVIFEKIAQDMDLACADIRFFKQRWLIKSTSGKMSRFANREKYLALIQEESSAVSDSAVSTNEYSPAIEKIIRTIVGNRLKPGELLRADEPLITSGLIDSLGLASLIASLEQDFRIVVSEDLLRDTGRFNTIQAISVMVKNACCGERRKEESSFQVVEDLKASDVPMRLGEPITCRPWGGSLWTLFYKILFWLKGIRYGKGLRIYGPLLLRIEGDPSNIMMGNNVTLMPWVDLKIREKGKIILGNGVFLDSFVRLVAARDAKIELGDEVKIGLGTVLNGGADILLGRKSFTAGYCSIMSSEHCFAKGIPIMDQGFEHAPVVIGEDVWIGEGVFVRHGSQVGSGAILSLRSVVSGKVPSGGIMFGNPARLIKYRELGS